MENIVFLTGKLNGDIRTVEAKNGGQNAVFDVQTQNTIFKNIVAYSANSATVINQAKISQFISLVASLNPTKQNNPSNGETLFSLFSKRVELCFDNNFFNVNRKMDIVRLEGTLEKSEFAGNQARITLSVISRNLYNTEEKVKTRSGYETKVDTMVLIVKNQQDVEVIKRCPEKSQITVYGQLQPVNTGDRVLYRFEQTGLGLINNSSYKKSNDSWQSNSMQSQSMDSGIGSWGNDSQANNSTQSQSMDLGTSSWGNDSQVNNSMQSQSMDSGIGSWGNNSQQNTLTEEDKKRLTQPKGGNSGLLYRVGNTTTLTDKNNNHYDAMPYIQKKCGLIRIGNENCLCKGNELVNSKLHPIDQNGNLKDFNSGILLANLEKGELTDKFGYTYLLSDFTKFGFTTVDLKGYKFLVNSNNEYVNSNCQVVDGNGNILEQKTQATQQIPSTSSSIDNFNDPFNTQPSTNKPSNTDGSGSNPLNNMGVQFSSSDTVDKIKSIPF